MNKVWLESYPPGIPAEVDVNEFRSIAELFDKSVAAFGDRVAYVCMGREICYSELDHLAGNFANYLQSELKLAHGARVALMMPNVLQYPVALFGVLRAGCTVVNCNPLYTARELEIQLGDAGAEAIVVLENFAHVVQVAMPRTAVRHVVTTRLGDMLGLIRGALVNAVVTYVRKLVPPWHIDGAVPWSAALARGGKAEFIAPAVGPDDIAFLQYTGGTTGISKGAILTHRNIIANLQQAHVWLKPYIRERETIITALPLYHIFSLTANCLMFFKLGATNVLITNPRDIPGFVKELRRYRFSVITGVNTLFHALLNHPDFARLDFSALHITLGGGMAVQQPVAKRWQQVTGQPLIEAYGLTEASPAVTINPLDLTDYTGSIGLPIPSTEVAIRDDDGHDVAPGASGELCVRGPQVMSAYWQRPDETAQVLMADGFLRTGDVVTMDAAGYLRIVDRKKDMILVSGFNVYPNEVEAVVVMHPGVLEAAVVGVPDERAGEAVKLFVVRKDPHLSAAELIAYCRESLTAYKVPSIVEFRQELPKTNVGKILRRALRDGC